MSERKCLLIKNLNKDFPKVPTLASDLSAEEKANLRITVNSICQACWSRNFGETKEGDLPNGDHDRIALNACNQYEIIIQAGDPLAGKKLDPNGIEVYNEAGPVIGKRLEQLSWHLQGKRQEPMLVAVHREWPWHPSLSFQGWISARDLDA